MRDEHEVRADARQDSPTTPLTRRRFIHASGVAGVAGAVAPALAVRPTAGHAGGDQRLRVGVIGCGGRGRGACKDALTAGDDVVIVASVMPALTMLYTKAASGMPATARVRLYSESASTRGGSKSQAGSQAGSRSHRACFHPAHLSTAGGRRWSRSGCCAPSCCSSTCCGASGARIPCKQAHIVYA